MLAISMRKGLSPAWAQARRKVGSCMRGEHAATTTRFKPNSLMSFLICSCPGSEHMNLYSREITTPASWAISLASFSTSTVPAMLVPQ
jgi:hypothetical protein